jgi:hypothetical protein
MSTRQNQPAADGVASTVDGNHGGTASVVAVSFSSRFTSGPLHITAGLKVVADESERHAFELHSAMRRHLAGDWGNLEQEDKAANEHDIIEGTGRLLSKYMVGGEAIYVATYICEDALQNYTIAMLTSEY